MTIMIITSLQLKTYLKHVWNFITIEPLVCSIVMAKMVCGPALNNLQFEKACKVNAGFNDTVCDSIVNGNYLQNNFKQQNGVVQAYMTNLRSWEVPISSIVPVVLVLFLGSFSDRHKIRKPFLIMPIVGDLLSVIGCILSVVYMRKWSLEVQTVMDKVIPSLFGGEKLLVMMSYAYITDVSTPDERVIRMTTIPIVINIFTPIVQGISGILFEHIGYIPIFCISLCLLSIALLNGLIGVKEPRESKESKEDLIKDVCNIQHVVETLKLLTKNENGKRTNFLMVLLLAYIYTTVSSGEQNTFFMFTQAAYQWTAVDYSYFTTARTIANLIGLCIAVPLFSKLFQCEDVTIIIISYLDIILINVIYVAYQSPIGLYIGIVVSVLRAPGHAANRSLLTKSVKEEDTAKAFSLNIVTIAISSAIAAQIYHQGVYEHTRETFPQAFFLFGILMHVLGLPILIWLYIKDNKNKHLDAENEQKEKCDTEKQLSPICPTAIINDEMIDSENARNSFTYTTYL